MPSPTPLPDLVPSQILTFTGVDLRRDGVTMADGDVIRAINVDLHTLLGAATLRKGRTRLFDAVLSGSVRRLERHNGRRYAVAGTGLYRNETLLHTVSGEGLAPTLLSVQGLTDAAAWVLIADVGGSQGKVQGGAVVAWGIVRPLEAPGAAAGSAGALTGRYSARYTYARVRDDVVEAESTVSPFSPIVDLAAQRLLVSVKASSDPQVTHIRLYRTLASGNTALFETQVSNTTQAVALNQPDEALGEAGPLDHQPPPPMKWITEFQGHVFGCQVTGRPNDLVYSLRYQPEYFAPDNWLRLGLPDDPLQACVPMIGFLGVFSRRTKWRVSGNSIAGFSALEALNTRGTPAPQALLATSRGVGFIARDGLFVTNFVQADVPLTPQLEALFWMEEHERVHDYAPIDWSRITECSLAEYKQRLYFGYVDTAGQHMLAVLSQETGRWYFYAGHAVRSLWWDEHDDQLWMGDSSGRGWVLERGRRDDDQGIALDLVSREDASGERWRRKLALYLKIDADVPLGETAELELWLDGGLRYTLKVSGPRLKTLERLPDDLLYHTWHARWMYTGSGPCTLYGVGLLSWPLEER